MIPAKFGLISSTNGDKLSMLTSMGGTETFRFDSIIIIDGGGVVVDAWILAPIVTGWFRGEIGEWNRGTSEEGSCGRRKLDGSRCDVVGADPGVVGVEVLRIRFMVGVVGGLLVGMKRKGEAVVEVGVWMRLEVVGEGVWRWCVGLGDDIFLVWSCQFSVLWKSCVGMGVVEILDWNGFNWNGCFTVGVVLEFSENGGETFGYFCFLVWNTTSHCSGWKKYLGNPLFQ